MNNFEKVAIVIIIRRFCFVPGPQILVPVSPLDAAVEEALFPVPMFIIVQYGRVTRIIEERTQMRRPDNDESGRFGGRKDVVA